MGSLKMNCHFSVSFRSGCLHSGLRAELGSDGKSHVVLIPSIIVNPSVTTGQSCGQRLVTHLVTSRSNYHCLPGEGDAHGSPFCHHVAPHNEPSKPDDPQQGWLTSRSTQ